jgi:hypothetical protein
MEWTDIAHPWHHAIRSSKLLGGKPEDCLAVHDWFDESKEIVKGSGVILL